MSYRPSLMNDTTELARLELQAGLESCKTQADRNRNGQFATPTALATDILAYAKSQTPASGSIRFLDPAFGTGAFYSALLRTFPESQIAEAIGYEIDPDYARATAHLWGDTALDVRIEDFTRALPPPPTGRASLLICNPPYVRHHHLAGDDKTRLRMAADRAAGFRLSGLAGLYCYFMLIAHDWMAEDCLAGWLIPSEFMDVNYGRQVKDYLLSRVTLLRIHRFDPQDVQFSDALVSSAVVWFRKAKPPADHVVEFTYGGTLSQPRMCGTVSSDLLRRTAKWTALPGELNAEHSDRGLMVLSDLFTIKRGVATGANDFFILTEEKTRLHQLPAEFLIPILPSPRHLSCDEVEADAQGLPLIHRRLFLLACDRPEEEVRRGHPSLWNYLRKGVEVGVSERYLCNHRSPWYAQERRARCPFLCTYMGRQAGGSGRPMRFILNHSIATAPNVYLMLYPKPALAKVLADKPELLRVLWQALNSIPVDVLVGNGRVYGGGLHKLEPRELGNAPAQGILEAVPELGSSHVRQLALCYESRAKYRLKASQALSSRL